jgi:hypothetical protein
MRTSKIVFFSCEPGGAEILSPVIMHFMGLPQFTVQTLAYGHATLRFEKNGIPFEEIKPVLKNDQGFVESYRPDLIITSATSLPFKDMSERHLWLLAKQGGIPSFALLDQWQNYVIRFSGVEADENLKYLPDYINCINEIGMREMVEYGFDPARLVKLGHPYLSGLRDKTFALDRSAIQKKLGLKRDRLTLLFASEALLEHYGHTRGYTQYEALGLFLKICKAKEDINIVLKLHPKDSIEKYQEMIEVSGLNIKLIQNELTSVECIAISDEVYGMTSIMLVEAYILGKKVVSLQPNLLVTDECVLSRHGLILRVEDERSINANAVNGHFDFQWMKSEFVDFVESVMLEQT